MISLLLTTLVAIKVTKKILVEGEMSALTYPFPNCVTASADRIELGGGKRLLGRIIEEPVWVLSLS